jgi:hypothetical protein
MRKSDRDELRRRYGYRCGYCGATETDIGGELTVDHFQPRSRAGADTPENWVYCCHTCNGFKGQYWNPDSIYRVLHPLDDDAAEHISQDVDGRVLGLTITGAFHIEQLHLNRQPLVNHRLQKLISVQDAAVEASLRGQIREMEREIERLSRET